MKYRRTRNSMLIPMMFIVAALLFAVITAFLGKSPLLSKYSVYVAAAEFFIVAALVVVTIVLLNMSRREAQAMLSALALQLNPDSKEALLSFPLPLVLVNSTGGIEWYNKHFLNDLIGDDIIDEIGIEHFASGMGAAEIADSPGANVEYKGRCYTIYSSSYEKDGESFYAVYFVDDTYLKNISLEHTLSKPVVLYIAVDGTEESGKGYKNSDLAEIRTDIERLIESWSGGFNCMLKYLGTDRFLLITQSRFLTEMIKGRFNILDTVRNYKYGNGNAGITLSVGVGQGDSFEECEDNARQALDMCFGRGGDQAAVRHFDASYEFFGGVSKSVEKKTKVKSRIVAAAIGELVNASEDVLIMGHRFPDMDSLGSAFALCSAVRSMGKRASVVMEKSKSLALPLYERLAEDGKSSLIIEPSEAMRHVGKGTLLFIIDTHIKDFVENIEIYEKSGTVIVIDHHRKSVNHIDNAVVFYHDPGASSAAEMVTELLQYMTPTPSIGHLEADALLAGIMLDTKNFVLRAGVRTFEAAAYLKERGADTVKVKKMFSTTIESYRLRNRIISGSVNFHNCAISVADFSSHNLRVICSQAADELLNISDVDASFVLYEIGGGVNVSARSLGVINVQVIMEKLGGGGHQTMAAAQFKDISLDEVLVKLKDAIKDFYES